MILLIKIRTFLKKIDSYLEKYKFARRFKGLMHMSSAIPWVGTPGYLYRMWGFNRGIDMLSPRDSRDNLKNFNTYDPKPQGD